MPKGAAWMYKGYRAVGNVGRSQATRKSMGNAAINRSGRRRIAIGGGGLAGGAMLGNRSGRQKSSGTSGLQGRSTGGNIYSGGY